jgi:hypothetical protein
MFTFHSGDTNTAAAGPAIPVVASWTQTNAGDVDVSSLDMAPPPDIQAGNSLVIFAYAKGSDFGVVIPSGWEFLGFTSVSGSLAIGVFHKKTASGSEGAITITPTAACRLMGTYMRITGTNQTTLIDVSDYTESVGRELDSDIPAVTTTVDNCLALFGAVQAEGSGADITLDNIPPTEWAILDQDNTGLTTANMTSVFGFKEIPTAGTTEDVTVEWDSFQAAKYFQLAIKPV